MYSNNYYQWVVIGAGPAGLATVGKLLDFDVNPKNILWIDPKFMVGDFGQKWSKVPSNTRSGLFIKYLGECKAFEFEKCNEKFDLFSIPPDDTCELGKAAEPLLWVTQNLKSKVNTIETEVVSLQMEVQGWRVLLLNGKKIFAKNVVLAIGAEEKTLAFDHLKKISLENALNRDKLEKLNLENKTIAVFGSSHSAILVIRNLLEVSNSKRIINLYQSQLRYAIYLPDKIVYDNTGLKGTTALWAKENLHGKLPLKLERHYASQENIQQYIPQCSHVTYAVGFQKRKLGIENAYEYPYDEKTGIIAPGLFGIGIAFPQKNTDSYGIEEYSVGVWKFMEYVTQVLPIWLNYPC